MHTRRLSKSWRGFVDIQWALSDLHFPTLRAIVRLATLARAWFSQACIASAKSISRLWANAAHTLCQRIQRVPDMDCGKQPTFVMRLAIVTLLISGCDQPSERNDAGPIFVSAVSALGHSSARKSDRSRKVKSFLVAPGIAPSVASDAARVRPTSAAADSIRLKAGEVLIKEFRIEGRRSHLTLLVGPADPFPAPGSLPSCGSTETMTFRREWSGQWVMDTREQIVC